MKSFARGRFIGAFLVLSAFAAPFAGGPAAAQSAPPADAEHARLLAMAGDWNVTLALWPRPGRTAIQARGTSAIRPLFGGLFIQEDIDGMLAGMPFSIRAWTGYDAATRQYEATRISSTNPVRIAESGTYDDKTEQYELKADYVLAGDTWHQRTVIEHPSPNAMTATSYIRFGTLAEWKAAEIVYARRAN